MIEPKFIKKQSRGKRKSQSPQIIDEADNDLRLAATIIDECETEGQREEYISALQKHASVHIYGRCGAPCPGWGTEDCLRYLDKHYKVRPQRHEKSIIYLDIIMMLFIFLYYHCGIHIYL